MYFWDFLSSSCQVFPIVPKHLFVFTYLFLVVWVMCEFSSLPEVHIRFSNYQAFDTRYFHDQRRSVKCWLNKLKFFRMKWFTEIQSHFYLTRPKKFNRSDSVGVNSCFFFTVYIFLLKRDVMVFTSKEDEITFLEAKKRYQRYYHISVSFSTSFIFLFSDRMGLFSEKEQ